MVGARLGQPLAHGKALDTPWQFILVQSLMGHLMVGRHGLQNPRGFGLPGLTWFVVFVNDKPFPYMGLSA